MKNVFLWLLITMLAFSQIITLREKTGGKLADTAIHWGTPPHQSKIDQANLFAAWMAARGDQEARVVLEPESGSSQKFILQGVSGVAVDTVEFGSVMVRLFHEVGLLRPLDDLLAPSAAVDFQLDPATREEVSANGNLVAVPAGIWTRVIVYNTEVLARHGLKPPSQVPTFEELEDLGRKFQAAAGTGPADKRNYFLAQIGPYPVETFRRSLGLGRYNETLTAPMHRDARYIAALDRLNRWITKDKIIIGPTEAASMHMDQGIGGPNVQMFCKGKLAALLMPLWPLMQIRQLARIQMAASLVPNGGYANSDLSVRCIGVYKGSKRMPVAENFVRFFASPEYGAYLIGTGDSAPADPRLMKSQGFLKPKGLENEWSMREFLVKAHGDYAISGEYSPWMLAGLAEKTEERALQTFLSGIDTAPNIAQGIAQDIEKLMADYLYRHPEKQADHRKAVARQKELDRLKAELGLPAYGTPEELRTLAPKLKKKLPLSLIDNPFYRRYYKDMGVGE